MDNLEQILYTYKHRKVVMFLGKLYFKNQELNQRLENHDMDKMFMLLFYDKKNISAFHRENSSHHDNKLEKTELDYIEMVLDWESARYTKDDKPRNAFDTLYKFYPHLENKILPILEKIGLNYSTFNKDERVVDYVKSLDNITIEDIKKEYYDSLVKSLSIYNNKLIKRCNI